MDVEIAPPLPPPPDPTQDSTVLTQDSTVPTQDSQEVIVYKKKCMNRLCKIVLILSSLLLIIGFIFGIIYNITSNITFNFNRYQH